MRLKQCKWIALFLLTLYAAPLRADVVSDISILDTHRDDQHEIRSIIGINKGDLFDPTIIDASITRLRQWGVFETIHVTFEPADSGIRVDYHLKDAVLIGEIGISGNYPFLDTKVRRYLTIRPGDLYTPDRIAAQADKIAQLYTTEGYFGTSVTSSVDWDPITQDAIVHYTIHKKPRLKIASIIVTGNHALPHGYFVSAINPYRHYNRKRLRDVAQGIMSHYHKRGYPKALVRIDTANINLDQHTTDITVDVKEGPLVDVAFTGNDRLSDRKLRKLITFAEAGGFDMFEMEESAKLMTQAYRSAGYPDARITNTLTRSSDNRWLATFNVDEGRREVIHSLHFDGNTHMSESKLRRQMLTQSLSVSHRGGLNDTLLRTDTAALSHFYRTEGFLDANIGTPDIERVPRYPEQLTITIPVDEGKQTILSTVTFVGNEAFDKDELIKRLKLTPKHPFNPTQIARDQHAIVTYYVDNGYPYVTVTPETSVAYNFADITYNINEGPLVTIGEIVITGDSLTSQKSIRHSMSIHEGDPYSYRRILDSELGLRRTGAFQAVRIEAMGLDEKSEVVHLVVKVEEAKPLKLDFNLGYSSDDLVSGGMTFTNSNSFGWAKTSSLKLTGGQQLSRGEIGWLDPRFLGHDLQLTPSLWLQYSDEQTFNYMQTGGRVALSRIYHRTGFLVGYEVNRNYFVEGSSVAADTQSLRDNTISKLTLSASFDTRNRFADPTRGIWASSAVETFNEIRGNQANFFKFKEVFGHYYSPLGWITIANEARLTHIQTVGSNVSIPQNERLFMGGDTTLRGFHEDSLGPTSASGAIGGRTRWITNHELRLPITDGFKTALFYDMGSLTDGFEDIDLTSIRQSAGFGLRYITPVGPIRADFGFPIDKTPTDPTWRFHFTFGYMVF